MVINIMVNSYYILAFMLLLRDHCNNLSHSNWHIVVSCLQIRKNNSHTLNLVCVKISLFRLRMNHLENW